MVIIISCGSEVQLCSEIELCVSQSKGLCYNVKAVMEKKKVQL